MKPPTITDIVQATASWHKVSYHDLLNKYKRKTEITTPRHIAQFLCCVYLKVSYEEIAAFFHQNNHTSPRSAFKKIYGEYNTYPSTREAVDSIISRLEQEGFAMEMSEKPTTTAGVNGRELHNLHCPVCGRLAPLSKPCRRCEAKYSEDDWAAFIEKTKSPYIGLAVNYTWDYAEAEDIVWGVYERLLLKDYSPSQREYIGVRAIINAGKNYTRWKGHRHYVPLLEHHHPHHLDSTEDRMDIEVLLNNEDGSISDWQHEVLLSYLFEGSYINAAKELGVEVSTIKSNLHSARVRLKQEYSELLTA